MFKRMQQCLSITIPQSLHDILYMYTIFCVHVTLKGEAPGGLDGLFATTESDRYFLRINFADNMYYLH